VVIRVNTLCGKDVGERLLVVHAGAKQHARFFKNLARSLSANSANLS
jgi:hypothetical protein